MAVKDLREWLALLEGEGELHRIAAEVDWHLELSVILRECLARRGPAVLFENIKDYKSGRCTRLFANGLGNRARLALMFGKSKETPYTELITTLEQRMKQLVPPVTVDTGPVKETILHGDEVNVLDFPAPFWHEFDGGRYINTWCGVVTMDPETGDHNVGTYRGMIVDAHRIATVLIATQGWGRHFAKHQRTGTPMPVAVVIGADPAFVFAAGTPFQANEYEIQGAVRQAPVELVKCETSDLMVPAGAEIVLEGTISTDPDTYEMEGPFGEYTGVYGGIPERRPVIEVSCITHRNDPIFRGNIEGPAPGAPNETSMCAYIGYSAVLLDILHSQGHTGVLDIIAAPWTIVKIHKSYEGQARHVAACLWGTGVISNNLKTIVVVEDDVDIHNLRQVQAAIANFADAEKDYVVYPMHAGCPGDPALSRDKQNEAMWGGGLGSRLLIDATVSWPDHPIRPEWGNRRTPPSAIVNPPELVERVRRRWREFGFAD